MVFPLTLDMLDDTNIGVQPALDIQANSTRLPTTQPLYQHVFVVSYYLYLQINIIIIFTFEYHIQSLSALIHSPRATAGRTRRGAEGYTRALKTGTGAGARRLRRVGSVWCTANR